MTEGRTHPCLWFETNARQAVDYWMSIFPDGKVHAVHTVPTDDAGVVDSVAECAGVTDGDGLTRSGRDDLTVETGRVIAIEFELRGQRLVALNGGQRHPFMPAISIQVICDRQDEIDYLWTALSDGGEEGQCGWLTDRFGLSWQIVPHGLPDMLSASDRDGAGRAMAAMIEMRKMDIATLSAAFEGRA